MKQTIRQFVFATPSGTTEKQLIRTFIRASDGTDYPVDREIEVDVMISKTVEYLCREDYERTCENTTEAWALSQEVPGTIAISCTDICTEV